MASIAFNPHDECFNCDASSHPPIELYAIHDREELATYGRATSELGIKPEVEAFQYGAIWNAEQLVRKGLLKTPVWCTFFLGWRGCCWTPPTAKALMYMRSFAGRVHLQHERDEPRERLPVLPRTPTVPPYN